MSRIAKEIMCDLTVLCEWESKGGQACGQTKETQPCFTRECPDRP